MLDEKTLKIIKNRDFFSKDNYFNKYKNVKSKLIYGKHKDNVFVTIVIPTYKRAATLKETINSILCQEGFDNYEILIVDNENDFENVTETEKLVQEINSDKIVYYKNEKNIGMYANWNRCIELAKTKWICMVHDDDVLVKNHLNTMVNILNKNKGKKISYLACRYRNVYENKENKKDLNYYAEKVNVNANVVKKRNYKDFNLGFDSMFLGALVEREKVIEVGGFMPDSAWVEDYMFVAKFSYYYDIYRLEEPLYVYRYANNQSLKTEIWEDQIVYEYYLYKYISEKRGLLKNVYLTMSKYMTLIRMNEFIDGKSFLNIKCNINKGNVYKMCGFKSEKINKNSLFISKGIRKATNIFRDTCNILVLSK